MSLRLMPLFLLISLSSQAFGLTIDRIAAGASCRDAIGVVRTPPERPKERANAQRVSNGMVKTNDTPSGADCYLYLNEAVLSPRGGCPIAPLGGPKSNIAGTIASAEPPAAVVAKARPRSIAPIDNDFAEQLGQKSCNDQ